MRKMRKILAISNVGELTFSLEIYRRISIGQTSGWLKSSSFSSKSSFLGHRHTTKASIRLPRAALAVMRADIRDKAGPGELAALLAGVV